MSDLVIGLPATLNQIVSLSVQSTPKVLQGVRSSWQYNKKPAVAGAPQPKAPMPVHPTPRVLFSPIDLLQTLGLAMLPPRHIARHLATLHWTLIRYGYLIRAGSVGAPLATNGLVGDYRFHHMTALSEAFGVGCALSYVREWLVHCTPDAEVRAPIDFDYLLGPAAVRLPGAAASISPQLAPNATRQPDYLVAAERPNKDVRLMIIECKGTSGSQTRALGQLGSAMHQLACIVFAPSPVGPIAIGRHAYAACVSKAGGAINLYGVDPEDEGEPWVQPAIPAARDERPVGERDAAGRLHLPSPEEVSGRLMRRLDDRLAAWAGAGDSLEEVDTGKLRRRESDFGDLVGTTSSVAFPEGRTVEVFTGTLLKSLEAARDPQPERARERRNVIRSEILGVSNEAERGRTRRLRSNDDPERVASVITEEGLALRIEVA